MDNNKTSGIIKACTWVILLFSISSLAADELTAEQVTDYRTKNNAQIVARKKRLKTSWDAIAIMDISRENIQNNTKTYLNNNQFYIDLLQSVTIGIGFKNGVVREVITPEERKHMRVALTALGQAIGNTPRQYFITQTKKIYGDNQGFRKDHLRVADDYVNEGAKRAPTAQHRRLSVTFSDFKDSINQLDQADRESFRATWINSATTEDFIDQVRKALEKTTQPGAGAASTTTTRTTTSSAPILPASAEPIPAPSRQSTTTTVVGPPAGTATPKASLAGAAIPINSIAEMDTVANPTATTRKADASGHQQQGYRGNSSIMTQKQIEEASQRLKSNRPARARRSLPAQFVLSIKDIEEKSAELSNFRNRRIENSTQHIFRPQAAHF